ncbi:hypothetical protein MDOR_11850 [Mycolicibacterium doricum]|jgi:hypothetical protein|uniref:Uncharacterized protein n=1 Tax=Mycolicibacterium doricum TaxID=126673 RepID=A0A1X1SXY8_9MYCO|nr:hypothetical protein [Mycolicibacterium doricum]MCV7269015.1 hypothetical protein [Mycolicibacterium doricum]ORV36039.1 hypothetical protein AWC01_17485 [Mycolicibacterium doricum]BBZ07016.1 hypothetical protein MDOR_11850 [Mycolicibacterium doricum]
MWRHTVTEGLIAGSMGVAVMTVAEKIEQRLTGRPNSYVPADVWSRLSGARDMSPRARLAANWGMHYGQGALLGVLRSVMSEAGLRGPLASGKFTVLRLTTDQILENATGIGAPPATWPRREQVIDVLHKGVYAFATGAVTDALAARRGPSPGQRHAHQLPGRHADVGPVT